MMDILVGSLVAASIITWVIIITRIIREILNSNKRKKEIERQHLIIDIANEVEKRLRQ